MLINIAIDGPSAAGKSTIAKALAKKLKYTHIDTGAMYRSVALLAVQRGLLEKPSALAVEIENSLIDFDVFGNIYLNGDNVSIKIREHEVSMLASKVSQYREVRQLLVKKQQQMANKQGYILDGRDIGSVVLPYAQVKIFLVASVESRAERRFKELQAKGQEINFSELCEDIKVRDDQDMNRTESPLIQCEDAILVDTSNMSKDEVISAITTIVENKIITLGGM